MNRLRRAESHLDGAAAPIVALAIVAAAAGFSSQPQIYRLGGPLRWAMLAVLFAFAVARVAAGREGWRFPRRTLALLAVFCALSLVSAAWSVNARGTLERAVAQPVVVAALALLVACAVPRPGLGRSLLDGVLAGAAAVAVAGFVYWLVDPSGASIAATVEYPSRYRGIEGSPDTAPLLLAIAMPIALWRALVAAGARRRSLHVALLVVFAVSISATGSRGGLVAAFLASLVVVVLAPLGRRPRAALVALVAAGLVVAAWSTTIAKPLPAAQAPATATGAGSTHNAELVLPQTQEIGNPWWTHRSGGARRSLFNTSVRLRALDGAVSQALERPILGHGFGAEQWAFINRYYAFSSQNPENGYVGILLQLGIVGVVLWLVALGACFVSGVRACLRDRRHPFAVGAVGAAAGALLMGLSQSYFHGPGGIGYVALWTSLLLCAAAGVAPPRSYTP